MHSYPHH